MLENTKASTANNKLVVNCFKSFMIKAFHVLQPHAQFVDNWHIDLILEYLGEIEKGKIKRLLINIPPRSLKSTIISVVWPAWVLAKDPAKRIIVASYSQILSLKHSQECRTIMCSKWYKEDFPETRIVKGSNEKFKFITTKQGFRFATSVGGTLTGEGADILIVDDPHTPLQACSSSERHRAIDWYDQTFSSRLNDKKKGVILVVMQRLHQDDLSGHLLGKKVWKCLKLPAIAQEEINYKMGKFHYLRKRGELLIPSREGEKEIELARLELGSYAFNAQYQQDPIPLSSGIIKPNWIKYYNPILEKLKGVVVQSWDCAIKVGFKNNYSVCTTWVIDKNKAYLLDLIRGKYEYQDLKELVIEKCAEFNPSVILVEDKASGQSLLQELREDSLMPLVGRYPNSSKDVRLLSCVGFFESGKILFPENAQWLTELEAELFLFPNARYDDQVDSITQFLEWFRSNMHEMHVGLKQIN